MQDIFIKKETPNYDTPKRGLASIVYKFFDFFLKRFRWRC